MVQKRIRIPNNSSIEIINEIGKLDDAIEFVDLHPDVLEGKKPYAPMIKRCDEVEKVFIKLDKIGDDYNMKRKKYTNYNIFLNDLQKEQILRDRKYGSVYFDLIESEVLESDKQLNELLDSHDQIKDALEILIEKKAVYEKAVHLLSVKQPKYGDTLEESARLIEEGAYTGLNYIFGVIKAEDEMKLKRMIHRVSRGRAVCTFFDLDNRIYNNREEKVMFY